MKLHNFFPKVYTDKETERLSKEYDVMSCSDKFIPSTLGQVDYETGAQKLLSISKCFGKFVGVSLRDIENFEWDSDFKNIDYLYGELTRTKRKGKLEILFPTEELLINQKVKEK